MAKWQEVTIRINRDALEGASVVLEKWGIENFAVEDSALVQEAEERGWGDYFPPVEGGEQVTIACYFSEDFLTQEQLEELRQDLEQLSQFGFETGSVVVQTGEVEEEDWAHAWKEYYRPLRIGQVLIQPSWEPLGEEAQGALVVELDPGMAFGTGTHPSTAMCIEFLQDLNLENRLLWDVGTGSGILAIVAAKLGAKVEAVDVDPVAVRVTKENRDRNEVQFSVFRGSLEDLRGEPQVIVANIIADVIGPMLPQVQQVLAPRGFFIASGVIQNRDEEIRSLAKDAGLKLLRRKGRGEWVAYLFQRGD